MRRKVANRVSRIMSRGRVVVGIMYASGERETGRAVADGVVGRRECSWDE